MNTGQYICLSYLPFLNDEKARADFLTKVLCARGIRFDEIADYAEACGFLQEDSPAYIGDVANIRRYMSAIGERCTDKALAGGAPAPLLRAMCSACPCNDVYGKDRLGYEETLAAAVWSGAFSLPEGKDSLFEIKELFLREHNGKPQYITYSFAAMVCAYASDPSTPEHTGDADGDADRILDYGLPKNPQWKKLPSAAKNECRTWAAGIVRRIISSSPDSDAAVLSYGKLDGTKKPRVSMNRRMLERVSAESIFSVDDFMMSGTDVMQPSVAEAVPAEGPSADESVAAIPAADPFSDVVSAGSPAERSAVSAADAKDLVGIEPVSGDSKPGEADAEPERCDEAPGNDGDTDCPGDSVRTDVDELGESDPASEPHEQDDTAGDLPQELIGEDVPEAEPGSGLPAFSADAVAGIHLSEADAVVRALCWEAPMVYLERLNEADLIAAECCRSANGEDGVLLLADTAKGAPLFIPDRYLSYEMFYELFCTQRFVVVTANAELILEKARRHDVRNISKIFSLRGAYECFHPEDDTLYPFDGYAKTLGMELPEQFTLFLRDYFLLRAKMLIALEEARLTRRLVRNLFFEFCLSGANDLSKFTTARFRNLKRTGYKAAEYSYSVTLRKAVGGTIIRCAYQMPELGDVRKEDYWRALFSKIFRREPFSRLEYSLFEMNDHSMTVFVRTGYRENVDAAKERIIMGFGEAGAVFGLKPVGLWFELI